MKSFKENLDIGSGNLFHPSKQSEFSNVHDVEQLFPDLGPEAQRYLELVASESYKKAVERLQLYTGLDPARTNLPQMLSLVMQNMQRVVTIQSQHKQKLEQLAIDTVLSLPEFEMFKELVDAGMIKIDAKLTDPNLQNAQVKMDMEPVDENGLDEAEVANSALATEFMSIDDRALRRQFAKMVTQGNATNKLYLFQLANDSLNEVDPKLVKMYGILSSVVHMSYYAMPVMNFTNAVKDAAVGSVEVVPDEAGNEEGGGGSGGYTIKAYSPFFPYLIHEIVKGLYEYISMDVATDAQLAGETLDSEVMEIMAGPQLYTNFAKQVPQSKVKYLPLIFKLLLRKDINTIKEVLSGGGRASNIIAKIAHEAEQMMNEHGSSQDEPWSDSE